ncbi:MAG: hypothetical protein AAGF11_11455 [Myxococcota bacterium]
MLGSLLSPGSTGCIYPDRCIKVTSPGHDWCRNLTNALQWPAGGSIDEAEPVIYANGATPKGCRCFNDAEHQVLEDKVPECQFEWLLDELEQAARQECQALVKPGYDHNCWTVGGADASVVEPEFPDGMGGCIGNCEYGNPPAGGACPDHNPYECATGGDGGGAGACELEEGADTSTGGGDSGSEGGVLEPSKVISCHGNECEIDETFAWDLYADPSLLLEQGVRIAYDVTTQRHIFDNIAPGTVLHALGLRDGDRLEHVNDLVIDDLDSALQAYLDNQDATILRVRILRGDQWVDYTYTFVR